MKRYNEYIIESRKVSKIDWFLAIYQANIKRIKFYIDCGVDVNLRNDYDQTIGSTALMISAINYKSDVVKLLLEQPGIDLNMRDNVGQTFMEYQRPKLYLIDYNMQKKILDNGREDIILLFDKYNLIHPDIKKEYPNLFKANNWGLI